MDTDEPGLTPIPDSAPLSTPLGIAIGRASAAHPSLKAGAQSIVNARRSAISIAAKAMAVADDADFLNPHSANHLASQMVDEAALSLGLSQDRTTSVSLNPDVDPRHTALALALDSNPTAKAVGFDKAKALARTERALGRALRIRSAKIKRDGDHEALLINKIIRVIVSACIARRVSVNEMNDDDLMELVEDASDLVLNDGAQF